MPFRRLKSAALRNRPLRFLLKSAKNVFFPAPYRTALGETATVEVSNVCNARCVFCIYPRGYRAPRMMEVGDFEKIAASLVALGYRNLDLTAMTGELFTHPRAIEIIQTAKRVGFAHVGVFSNGILVRRFDPVDLLNSGVDALLFSFPGFGREHFTTMFGVDGWEGFAESMTRLLDAHRALRSRVFIVFEPRSRLSDRQLRATPFFEQVIAPNLGDRVEFREPLRVFDTWAGEVAQSDLLPGMVADVNPMKSLPPFTRPFLCGRMAILGVQANGDVRLCSCRYDRTIETSADSLYIDNVHRYPTLEALLAGNAQKVASLRRDFVHGILPALCRSCSFYAPVRIGLPEISALPPRANGV